MVVTPYLVNELPSHSQLLDDLAASIRLGPKARVLVVNPESTTDPALYEKIVGRSPQAVLKGEIA